MSLPYTRRPLGSGPPREFDLNAKPQPIRQTDPMEEECVITLSSGSESDSDDDCIEETCKVDASGSGETTTEESEAPDVSTRLQPAPPRLSFENILPSSSRAESLSVAPAEMSSISSSYGVIRSGPAVSEAEVQLITLSDNEEDVEDDDDIIFLEDSRSQESAVSHFNPNINLEDSSKEKVYRSGKPQQAVEDILPPGSCAVLGNGSDELVDSALKVSVDEEQGIEINNLLNIKEIESQKETPKVGAEDKSVSEINDPVSVSGEQGEDPSTVPTAGNKSCSSETESQKSIETENMEIEIQKEGTTGIEAEISKSVSGGSGELQGDASTIPTAVEYTPCSTENESQNSIEAQNMDIEIPREYTHTSTGMEVEISKSVSVSDQLQEDVSSVLNIGSNTPYSTESASRDVAICEIQNKEIEAESSNSSINPSLETYSLKDMNQAEDEDNEKERKTPELQMMEEDTISQEPEVNNNVILEANLPVRNGNYDATFVDSTLSPSTAIQENPGSNISKDVEPTDTSREKSIICQSLTSPSDANKNSIISTLTLEDSAQEKLPGNMPVVEELADLNENIPSVVAVVIVGSTSDDVQRDLVDTEVTGVEHLDATEPATTKKSEKIVVSPEIEMTREDGTGKEVVGEVQIEEPCEERALITSEVQEAEDTDISSNQAGHTLDEEAEDVESEKTEVEEDGEADEADFETEAGNADEHDDLERDKILIPRKYAQPRKPGYTDQRIVDKIEGELLKLKRKLLQVDMADYDLNDESFYTERERIELKYNKYKRILGSITREKGLQRRIDCYDDYGIRLEITNESSKFQEERKVVVPYINKYLKSKSEPFMPPVEDIEKLIKHRLGLEWKNMPPVEGGTDHEVTLCQKLALEISEDLAHLLKRNRSTLIRKKLDNWTNSASNHPAEKNPDLPAALEKNRKAEDESEKLPTFQHLKEKVISVSKNEDEEKDYDSSSVDTDEDADISSEEDEDESEAVSLESLDEGESEIEAEDSEDYDEYEVDEDVRKRTGCLKSIKVLGATMEKAFLNDPVEYKHLPTYEVEGKDLSDGEKENEDVVDEGDKENEEENEELNRDVVNEEEEAELVEEEEIETETEDGEAEENGNLDDEEEIENIDLTEDGEEKRTEHEDVDKEEGEEVVENEVLTDDVEPPPAKIPRLNEDPTSF